MATIRRARFSVALCDPDTGRFYSGDAAVGADADGHVRHDSTWTTDPAGAVRMPASSAHRIASFLIARPGGPVELDHVRTDGSDPRFRPASVRRP